MSLRTACAEPMVGVYSRTDLQTRHGDALHIHISQWPTDSQIGKAEPYLGRASRMRAAESSTTYDVYRICRKGDYCSLCDARLLSQRS
jgi:hypothetical protein